MPFRHTDPKEEGGWYDVIAYIAEWVVDPASIITGNLPIQGIDVKMKPFNSKLSSDPLSIDFQEQMKLKYGDKFIKDLNEALAEPDRFVNITL